VKRPCAKFIFIIWAAATLAVQPARAQLFAPRPDGTITRLWIVPTRLGLWVAVEIEAEQNKSLTLRAGYRTEKDRWYWKELTGKVKSLTAVNEELCVAFDEGPIYRYDKLTDQSVRKLPENYQVEVMATDAHRQRLLCLAQLRSLSDIDDKEPKDPQDPDKKAPAEAPSSSYTIYEYDRGRWIALVDLPQGAETATEFKFAVQTGRIDLVGRTGPDSLSQWVYEDSRWQGPTPLDLAGPCNRFWVTSSPMSNELTLVTDRGGEGPDRFSVFRSTGPGQVALIGHIDPTDKQILQADVSDIGFAADSILIACLVDQKSIKLAKFDLSTRQTTQPEDLPLFPQRTADPIPLLILTALILALIFTRSFRPGQSTDLTLPAGLALADPWRRLLAAAVDLLPIFILVLVIWSDYVKEMRNRELLELLRTAEQDPQALAMGYFLTLGFCLYTAVTEFIWSATPGKMLLELRVRSSKSPQARPSPGQIIIRNVSKILELSFPPLLFVILFTRLRQRIGDILAGTIVVQSASVEGTRNDG